MRSNPAEVKRTDIPGFSRRLLRRSRQDGAERFVRRTRNANEARNRPTTICFRVICPPSNREAAFRSHSGLIRTQATTYGDFHAILPTKFDEGSARPAPLAARASTMPSLPVPESGRGIRRGIRTTRIAAQRLLRDRGFVDEETARSAIRSAIIDPSAPAPSGVLVPFVLASDPPVLVPFPERVRGHRER